VGDQSDGKSCPEVITRTYRSTDACGNYTDFVQKITVDDDVKPSADPLDPIKVSCESNIPSADPSSVQASDNCSQVTVIHVGDVSDGKYCPEIITRTYRVLDACGNSIELTQKITVDDDIAPTITSGPADVALACDASVPAADTDLVQATDNCGAVSVLHIGDQSDGKTCPMTITRRYRATDGCGNTADFVQKLTIGDDEPPVLSSCGDDKTVECPTSLPFDRPTATDNCDDDPSVRVVHSDSTLGPDAWTYRVTRTFQAFDECGNASATCDQTITAHCEVDALCSFTQGFYGNYGGKFNNVPTIEIVRSLLKDNPLVVGKPGRSLKFNYNAADCIVARLPAGKTATTLPDIGNANMNQNTCQTPTPIPVDSQGKFQNVFLGQTITLSLNARLSPWMNLFPLTESFCTQGALAGRDGKLGTPDDMVNPASAVETYHIHPTVLTALDNLGLPRLVAGLIELCNRGLAAQPTGGASLAAISSAADAINNGFDGCRFIVECGDERVTIGPGTKLTDGAGSATLMPAGPTQFELRQNAPNPFNPATSIRLAIPKATSWSLAIYDVRGRLVRSFDGTTGGPQFVDVRWDGTDNRGAPVSSGVYFYRVNAADFRDVKKMVLLK
jgi:hypothetical protein